MGRIQTSIGLITGTPIADTVDQLINLSAVPRDRLSARNEGLKQQRSAINNLTVLAVGIQVAARGLNSTGTFTRTKATSSDADVLSVVRSGQPNAGTYQVRTLKTAGTQAFKSTDFASSTASFGTSGSLTVRGGGYVDRSASLTDLNGGRGVQSGSIRITDRSGESAIIDLSTASTIDDVLRKINENTDIRVTATTDGDAIRLIDDSGSTVENLKVEEVGDGETAADLGLRGINTSSSTAQGADILRLSNSNRLSTLRDGRGLDFASGDDIEINLKDGTNIALDFGDFSREAAQARGATNSTTPNAGLTFTATESGASGDGVRIRFIDDPAVSKGNETVERIETANGSELVFSIDAGSTTASDIAAALAADSDLADAFSAVADGDGTGLISTDDEASLSGGTEIKAIENPTIGDLLRVINDIDPTKLRAELAPGGDSLRIVDLTSGDQEFSIADVGSSRVATNLGWTATPVDGVVTGGSLQSGLSTVSLDALSGGNGLGVLSELEITTADGSSATIDVSASRTLQDVINAVNESGLNIEASIDRTGAGLQVRDLTGGSATTFSISSSDDTASKLGLEGSTTDVLLQGKSLDLQFVSRSTKLSSLNQGQGIGDGSFRITDSNGNITAINLKVNNLKTVGDLIDQINGSGIDVTASVNETGDGIRLIDTGEGAGTLTIVDTGTGTSAKQLGIAGSAKNSVVNEQIVSTINGRQVDEISISATDNLTSLVEKIKTEARFTSATLISGAGGASLSLSSNRGGTAGRLSIASSGIDLGIQQTVRGQDAVIAVGGADGGSPTILTSSDGVFTDAIEGLTFTAKKVSSEPVTVKVESDKASVESAVKRFVDQFNSLNDKIAELTVYDSDTNEVGVLFGRSETLRIQTSLNRLLTTRINTGTSIRTAADVGLRVDSTGKLNLDSTKFQAALEESPDAVAEFFAKEETVGEGDSEKTNKVGFAAKVDELLDRIAGEGDSVLLSRALALNTQIDRNDGRITTMNSRLEKERERLLKQFYDMESAIAKVQSNQQYLSSISYIGSAFSSSN